MIYTYIYSVFEIMLQTFLKKVKIFINGKIFLKLYINMWFGFFLKVKFSVQITEMYS